MRRIWAIFKGSLPLLEQKNSFDPVCSLNPPYSTDSNELAVNVKDFDPNYCPFFFLYGAYE